VRSRLLDCVSSLMSRGVHIDKCLEYVHVLIHADPSYAPTAGPYMQGAGLGAETGMMANLPDHTFENLKAGLVHVSLEPSGRGVAACRLEKDLMDARHHANAFSYSY
jgi:hypothetical protein